MGLLTRETLPRTVMETDRQQAQGLETTCKEDQLTAMDTSWHDHVFEAVESWTIRLQCSQMTLQRDNDRAVCLHPGSIDQCPGQRDIG